MALDPHEVFLREPDDDPQPVTLKALTVRLPLRTFRFLEEMAEHADLSRNAMAVQLVEWGIAHAMDRLPEELAHQIGTAVDGPDFDHFFHNV